MLRGLEAMIPKILIFFKIFCSKFFLNYVFVKIFDFFKIICSKKLNFLNYI